jgi:antitoxin CptB
MPAMTGREKGGSSEVRRKRLLFRAQRRGFKEVDIIFGTFAEAELARMPEGELDAFEALLDAPDQEVYAWLRGEARAPVEFETAVLARMKALCARKNPTWNA